ncbi:MAG: preprotein translocase subunit SecG [Candidatus Roizmanbacteria bacterium]|nr:MAG: preprotein translocase subunit SecG [Candidatus Roizmanbacteria bacterium]
MKTFLLLSNIVIAITVIVLVLIQGRGAGLGSAWGGGGEFFQTRRGIEKITLRLTIFFIILFFIISLLNLFISR